jgi:amphi-Trp domain-containing protein
MVKKKIVQATPGGKKPGASGPKKSASRKKAAGKQLRKKPATGKGTSRAINVKVAKKMTSELKPKKEAATMLEELLPADRTGEGSKRESVEKKKKKKSKVKFKSVMLREEAISYFEAIVAGLKRGSIQIRQGEDAITLKPTPQLDVAVKAVSKDQDEGIVFEIGWRTASDSELTISTE